jgi:hypothetical protein
MKRTGELGPTIGSLVGLVAATALVAGCGGSELSSESTGSNAAALRSDSDRRFNRPGDILISDQFNNRIIEIDRAGNVVWQFGLGPSDLTATSLLVVNDAQRVGSLTLAAGTGVPAASPPFVDVSIATRTIVWQYGTTGVSGIASDQLNNPNSAELLANGHILISDQGNNRAIEVDREKNIKATFTAGGTASIVAFASRLENGDTLLTDSGNSRIVEVDKEDAVVWQYFTNTDAASNASPRCRNPRTAGRSNRKGPACRWARGCSGSWRCPPSCRCPRCSIRTPPRRAARAAGSWR